MTQINLSESKQETASFLGFRDNGQAAFVHIHDLPGNTESDAGTDRLGRKERYEDALLNVCRNACPVIADLDIVFSFRIDPCR